MTNPETAAYFNPQISFEDFQAMEKTKNHSITSEELIIKFYFLIKEAIMDGASVSSANLLFYSKFKPRRQPKPRFCH